MMNNNKILTVSYGTFSCTLEGFEDSFDTMKAIAEYFRDLAADDRYFGAEPPQPDAEMLAKIAEREVARRVEAREHEGRIMLKAHDDAPTSIPASVAAPAVAEAARDLLAADEEKASPSEGEASDVIADQEKEESEESAREQMEALEGGSDVDQETSADETAAETIAPGEAAERVAEDADAAEPREVEEDAAAVETDRAEEKDVEDVAEMQVAAEETAGADTAQDAEVARAVADDIDASAASFFAQGTADHESIDEMEEPISAADFTDFTLQEEAVERATDLETEEVEPAAPTLQTDSFAEKLARIRAVVSKQETDEPVADYDEDAEAQATVAPLEELEAAFEDAQAEEPRNEIIAEAAEDISIAFEQDDVAEERSVFAETEADDLDEILKRIEESSDDEAFDLSAASEDADDDTDEQTVNLFESPDDAGAETEADEVRGRVLKVNKSDLEAALASGELEEYQEENPFEAFSADSEAEPEGAGDLAAQNETPAQHKDIPEKIRQSLPKIDEEAGEDLSRLMAEADHQMQEPEGQTRRSAFAHLRAAVAARFADRSITKNKVDAEADAYRSDLAEVVKPRRPEAPSQRSERPISTPAQPLKLVAEQRIDANENAGSSAKPGPVSPRRVAASMEEDLVLTDDTGFAAYAEERGAESLPQVLEAAAAYLSFVEGHDQFSRPQLMSRVRQANCGEFSREDGLRSFGQLLRNGKIQKIKGGRFTASEAISYKPDHRAAG